MTTSTDRFNGLIGSSAVKPAVVVATTANITLAGLQTIDGIALIANDRVLVKNQTNAVNNGIWVASTGQWSRSEDFNGIYDAQEGTLIVVSRGNSNSGRVFILITQAPVIGTSSLTFSERLTGSGVREIATVADLRNFEPQYSGQVITLLGHTTAGIGGGDFRYDASDTTTADDDGVTIVTVGGKRWKRILNGMLTSDMYNGNAKKVIEGVTTKNAIRLTSDYNFSTTTDIKSDTTIDCAGYKFIPTTPITALSVEGTEGTYTALTANMTAGDLTFQATITLVVGDYVFIRSETRYPDPIDEDEDTVPRYGRIFKVTKVISANTYQIHMPASETFLTASTAQVGKLTMVKNVELRNVDINSDDYSVLFTRGLRARFTDGLRIRNFKATGSKIKYGADVESQSALNIVHCINIDIDGVDVSHIGWYGLEIAGACDNISVNNVTGYDCRHTVSFNWLNGYGRPRNGVLENLKSNLPTLSGIDTHANSTENIIFKNITSHYSGDCGIQIRSSGVEIDTFNCRYNANDGLVGRDMLTKVKAKNGICNNNLRNGISFGDEGADLIDCETNYNVSSGIFLSSGLVKGGESLGNNFGVRVNYSAIDDKNLVIDTLHCPNTGGQTPIYIDDVANYNPERLTLNSNMLYGVTNTPIIAAPSGNNEKLPLTNGHNKTFKSSEQGKQKGNVTLVAGTETVTTAEIRNYTGSSLNLSCRDNVRLKVITATNAGALRYTIVDKTSFTITSTNALDTSVIAWEITGF